MGDMMPKKRRIGTIPCKDQEIKRLREIRNWKQEQLAEESGVSRGTIQKMERGEPISPALIQLVADALDVPAISIMQNHDQLASQRDSINVGIELAKAFDEFTPDTEIPHVISAIKKIIGSKGAIYVIAVMPGSVHIILNMDKDDAENLVIAFKKGRLQELDVVRVAVSEPYERDFLHYNPFYDFQATSDSKSVGHKGTDRRLNRRAKFALLVGSFLLVAAFIYGLWLTAPSWKRYLAEPYLRDQRKQTLAQGAYSPTQTIVLQGFEFPEGAPTKDFFNALAFMICLRRDPFGQSYQGVFLRPNPPRTAFLASAEFVDAQQTHLKIILDSSGNHPLKRSVDPPLPTVRPYFNIIIDLEKRTFVGKSDKTTISGEMFN